MSKRRCLESQSVQNVASTGLVASLNDDCLLKLLEYFELDELCTVGCVCKKLQELVNMFFAKRRRYKVESEVRITAATFGRGIDLMPNDRYVTYFLKFMKNIRICGRFDRQPLELIRKNCSEHLDTIAFERIQFHKLHSALLVDLLSTVEEFAFFSCENLHKILKLCTNLKCLKIDQYSKDQSNKWMTKRYPTLQYLQYDIELNSKFLKFLTQNSNVKSLMLKLDNIARTTSQEQFLERLCCMKLEELMISFDKIRDLELVKNQLKAICDRPEFKRLELCFNDTSDTFMDTLLKESIFATLKELKSFIGLHILRFDFRSNFPSNIILEHVKVLQLAYISAPIHLWKILPNLEELYLSSLEDDNFQSLVTPFARHAVKLKKIVARDLKIPNGTENDRLARQLNDERELLPNACKLFMYFERDIFDISSNLTTPKPRLVDIIRVDFKVKEVVFKKPYLSNFEF